MFCYAAARRLALRNDAELVLDDITGFARDTLYHRHYMLDNFQVAGRKATRSEILEPFERYRRYIAKRLSRLRTFESRWYIEQEGIDFDPRLLSVRVGRCVYLDGLWQSERYFQDVQAQVRADFTLKTPIDARSMEMADRIRTGASVALHIRWFDSPDEAGEHNVSAEYYKKAIAKVESLVPGAHFYLFSDNPAASQAKLALQSGKTTIASTGGGESDAAKDLWLMSQCRHFITANSTFSWWAAWLASQTDKIVLTPGVRLAGKAAWGFDGLLPHDWIQL